MQVAYRVKSIPGYGIHIYMQYTRLCEKCVICTDHLINFPLAFHFFRHDSCEAQHRDYLNGTLSYKF